ncbi:MAG: ATP-binding protein, partial [Candidatus Limnocylindria bacterium]
TDLVGSTALATSVGPVRADELRVEHFSLLRAPMAEAGGREVKTTGDGLMVVFPTASAALTCAVAMQQALERRNRGSDSELLVRIGLSLGQADVRDDDYYGRPVVEAARLCAAAQGRQVLANDVMKAVDAGRSGLEFASLGELELKGLPPLSASEVLWEPIEDVEQAGRLPPALYAAPVGGYVGRASELDTLRRLWDEASAGERRVALLAGEPGIGKTRLSAHAALEMHQQGATVLYGRCQQGIAVPYEPWVQSLAHYVETGPERVLLEHVRGEGGELGRLVPELEHRLGELPPPRRTDPDVERYLLFRAVVRLLQRAARERPVVLVLDDLHWADANTLLLLRHVVPETAGERLLVLAAYRTTEAAQNQALLDALADLPRHPGVERLDLAGLERPEVVEFIEGIAGQELDRRGHALADGIFRETDGNPFFVGELLRHLSEAGAVTHGADGRWHVVGSPDEIGLPTSVRDVIGRRVDRLDPDVVSTLQIAAVIGPQFDLELLARVAGHDEDELLDLLDAAGRAALLAELPAPPGRFSFTHALIAHKLYEDVGAARAARLHRRIAERLEDLAGDDPGPRLSELARQWSAAASEGDTAKAIEYSHRAARRALDELAPDEAVRWFRQALELQRARGDADEPLTCDLLIGLGQAQRQSADLEHRDTLLRAAGIATRLGDADRLFEAAVTNTRGLYSTLGAIDRERIACLTACLDALPSVDVGRRGVIMALLASERSFDPDDRSRRALAEEAIELARASDDPRTLAVTLGYTFVPLAAPDTVGLRRGHAREVCEIAEALDDPSARFWSGWIEQNAAIEAGDLPAGEAAVADMRRLADDIREPTMNWLATALESTLLALHGRFEEAEQVAERAAKAGEGEPDALPVFAGQLAYIRWGQGRMDEVIELLEQAVEMAPGIPAYALGAADGYAETGRTEEANAVARRWGAGDLAPIPWDVAWALAAAILGTVVDITREREVAAAVHRRLRPWVHQMAHTHVACYGPLSVYAGMAAGVSGLYTEAEDLFARAVRDCERIEAPFLLARTHLSWGRMLVERAAAGDHQRALEHFDTALTLARRHGCAWIEREAGALAAA